MQEKTVKELRNLAREMEIPGYSRMRKKDLIQAIQHAAARHTELSKQVATTALNTSGDYPRPAVITGKSSTRQDKTSRSGTTAPEPVRQLDDEQRVEDAKYVTTAPGVPLPESEYASGLNEDIDTLPPVNGPRLNLLPQKPGLYHAYWTLEPGHLQRQPDLRLRLLAVDPGSAELLGEVPLPGDQGHWYFHTDPSLSSHKIYLQLGYYPNEGEFVTAIEHGTVRIPSLTASSRTDRNWWISDDEFRRLYLQAGGRLRRGRLQWPGNNTSSW